MDIEGYDVVRLVFDSHIPSKILVFLRRGFGQIQHLTTVNCCHGLGWNVNYKLLLSNGWSILASNRLRINGETDAKEKPDYEIGSPTGSATIAGICADYS